MESSPYIIVFLVISGALLLDVISMDLLRYIDTTIGRIILFSLPGLFGLLFGVPEAIMIATLIGLLIDKVHDEQVGSFINKPDNSVIHKTASTKQEPIIHPRKGDKVIRDYKTPYVSGLANKLGIIPLMSREEKRKYGISRM